VFCGHVELLQSALRGHCTSTSSVRTSGIEFSREITRFIHANSRILEAPMAETKKTTPAAATAERSAFEGDGRHRQRRGLQLLDLPKSAGALMVLRAGGRTSPCARARTTLKDYQFGKKEPPPSVLRANAAVGAFLARDRRRRAAPRDDRGQCALPRRRLTSPHSRSPRSTAAACKPALHRRALDAVGELVAGKTARPDTNRRPDRPRAWHRRPSACALWSSARPCGR